ncbi:MAG: hypothetical protein HC898_12250 [Phycisphaerales bacterium]|nr:hypothetical protein [Phycisphaerales bacterium]
MAMGDPLNPKVAFAGPYRTTDGGKTWTLMKQITGVLTASAKPYALFAAGMLPDGKTPAIFQSTDAGAKWSVVVNAEVYDLAYDAGRDRLYIAQREKGLAIWERRTGKLSTLAVPKDQHQSWRIRSVALDRSTRTLFTWPRTRTSTVRAFR